MDRGKPGSKMHVLSDANGLPLLVGVSAGNTHDSEGLKPMVEGHQTRHDPYRGRYFKPQRLHADKAYDRADLRRWLRGKRIGVRIARKGIESSERLGRRRWVIERTMSWLSGYRRLSPRYERDPRNYLAFLGLAATLCCYKRLVRLTTQDTVLVLDLRLSPAPIPSAVDPHTVPRLLGSAWVDGGREALAGSTFGDQLRMGQVGQYVTFSLRQRWHAYRSVIQVMGVLAERRYGCRHAVRASVTEHQVRPGRARP